MERIEKTFDVDCPVQTVYDQWTFPRFMEAEITEQVDGRRIAWRSARGAPGAGTLRFEPLDEDRTRVMLTMEYEPQGVVEKTGAAFGIVSHKVESAVEDFKKRVEKRPAPSGTGPAHGPGGTMHVPGSRKRQ